MRKTKEQKQKTNKGITLIALIITIIVMLILVAVTITIAVNGGLFEYAGRAGKETNEAIKNEQLLAEGIINGQTIDDIVGIAVKDDWYGITEEMETQEGVTEYHIQSCAELKKFANAVNAGNDFAGKTVYLDKNLDLQGNESKQWTPIGVDERHTFNGIFDGKNHFISGIYIDGNMLYAGLFGFAGNYESTNIIKNLGIKNSHISSNNGHVGGIVGYSCAIISYCYNEAEIKCFGGDNKTGGICGTNDNIIKNCYNIGTILGTGNSSFVGGIAGDNEYTIISCYNKGTIIGENAYMISGIAGTVGTFEDCYNAGILKGTAQEAYGICCNGEMFVNCYNIGTNSGNFEYFGPINNKEEYISSHTNCYYLSDVAEDNDVEGAVEAKTSAFMKTQEFVDILNNGRTGSEAIWKMDTNNINNGYPILFWQ
ncbi:MAG: hypothetical protein ACI4VP_02230 [Clostridia bacterium]